MSEFKVPEGWKLVPVEPTRQMLDEIHLVSEFTVKALAARYRAMLAAAPAAPVVQAEPVVTDAMREAAAKEMYRLGYGHHESDAESILIAAHAAHPDAALVEALRNMLAAFDNPIARRKLGGELSRQAIESARDALAGKGGE